MKNFPMAQEIVVYTVPGCACVCGTCTGWGLERFCRAAARE